jgi:hypothetical protein
MEFDSRTRVRPLFQPFHTVDDRSAHAKGDARLQHSAHPDLYRGPDTSCTIIYSSGGRHYFSIKNSSQNN